MLRINIAIWFNKTKNLKEEHNTMAVNLGNTAMNVIYGFLGVVLILVLGAALLPMVINASNVLGAIEGMPLAGLFTGGIITMIIVVGLIVAIIKGSSHVSK